MVKVLGGVYVARDDSANKNPQKQAKLVAKLYIRLVIIFARRKAAWPQLL